MLALHDHLVLRLNFTQTCFYLLAQDMGTIVGAAEQWRPYHTAQSGSPKTWAQFVIELDYSYRYLLEVCSELSDICFLIWLRYHMMLALHDRPVLAMVFHALADLFVSHKIPATPMASMGVIAVLQW